MKKKIQRRYFSPRYLLLVSALFSFYFLLFIPILSPSKDVVGPMEYYYGLVAGQGDTGNRDGVFSQALFQEPSGLALDAEETTLYVSDAGNNTIRTIDFNRQNYVSTLLGSHLPGSQDGTFSKASFNGPRNLAMLPNNLLAVYDSGNACVRIVNLISKHVTTWFQLDPNFVKGSVPDPSMAIYDMVYSTADQILYYTQPQYKQVMKVELGKSQPTIAFPQRAELDRPGPLVLHDGKLLVGNMTNGNIFPLEALQNTATAAVPFATTEPFSALASVGQTLFALPIKGEKILHPLDNTFTYLPTSEGDPSTKSELAWFFKYPEYYHPQLIASKLSEKKFFMTSSTNPVGVFYFKDYNFTELKDRFAENSQNLSDFEYPIRKPPKTFRILMVGDSHAFHIVASGSRPLPEYSRILTLPKRLEWDLNANAALNNSPIKYEVLLLGHAADDTYPIFLWPYYLTPKIAEKYDADLVIFLGVPQVHPPCSFWFQRPITPEGLPSEDADAEFFQKPWAEKAPVGTERRLFLDLCLKKNLVTIESDGFSIDFLEAPYLLHDPDVLDDIILLSGKPLGMLAKEMSRLRTKAGAPIPFAICYAPFTTLSLEDYNHLWRGIAEKNNIPLIDLTAGLTALRETRYPGREAGHEHFSPEGHDLVARVLAGVLLREHWIPNPSKP
jgi:hypothetical protein